MENWQFTALSLVNAQVEIDFLFWWKQFVACCLWIGEEVIMHEEVKNFVHKNDVTAIVWFVLYIPITDMYSAFAIFYPFWWIMVTRAKAHESHEVTSKAHSTETTSWNKGYKQKILVQSFHLLICFPRLITQCIECRNSWRNWFAGVSRKRKRWYAFIPCSSRANSHSNIY